MDAPARSHDVRVRRNVRAAALGVGIGALAAVVGWGYWGVITHGAVHVSLNDVALKTDRQLSGPVISGNLVFQDNSGTALAQARADAPLGVVYLIHPTAGDCRREERAGGEAWQTCFDTQSRWVVTWARRVRTARVSAAGCTIQNVPVIVEESRGRWWLWWIPVPHIDNSLYTYFELGMRIDSANCRAADPA